MLVLARDLRVFAGHALMVRAGRNRDSDAKLLDGNGVG
jgi:hypothetical protein